MGYSYGEETVALNKSDVFPHCLVSAAAHNHQRRSAFAHVRASRCFPPFSLCRTLTPRIFEGQIPGPF